MLLFSVYFLGNQCFQPVSGQPVFSTSILATAFSFSNYTEFMFNINIMSLNAYVNITFNTIRYTKNYNVKFTPS